MDYDIPDTTNNRSMAERVVYHDNPRDVLKENVHYEERRPDTVIIEKHPQDTMVVGQKNDRKSDIHHDKIDVYPATEKKEVKVVKDKKDKKKDKVKHHHERETVYTDKHPYHEKEYKVQREVNEIPTTSTVKHEYKAEKEVLPSKNVVVEDVPRHDYVVDEHPKTKVEVEEKHKDKHHKHEHKYEKEIKQEIPTKTHEHVIVDHPTTTTTYPTTTTYVEEGPVHDRVDYVVEEHPKTKVEVEEKHKHHKHEHKEKIKLHDEVGGKVEEKHKVKKHKDKIKHEDKVEKEKKKLIKEGKVKAKELKEKAKIEADLIKLDREDEAKRVKYEAELEAKRLKEEAELEAKRIKEGETTVIKEKEEVKVKDK